MSEPLKKAEKGFIARIGTVVSSLGARFSLATLIAAGGTAGVLLALGYVVVEVGVVDGEQVVADKAVPAEHDL